MADERWHDAVKKVAEVFHERGQLHKIKALWMRKWKDLASGEFTFFYGQLSNDWEDHLTVKYFSVE